MKASGEFFRKEFFKKVLERLYRNYPYRVDKKQLSLDVLGKEADEDIDAICAYLGDKALIVEVSTNWWRISALGIDFLEEKSLI